jgi:benzodiazapine receptor
MVGRRNRVLALLGFGGAVAGAALIGSRYSPGDLRIRIWYRRLNKPAFNPPDAIFAWVWTLLYGCMAVSGWRLWQQPDSPERSKALRLWLSQLVANAEWTKLFLGEHLPKWSLADVVTLESAVIAYIVEARKVDNAASALFVPYAAWVAFAALLNEEIVRRNPDAAELSPASA